MDRAMSIVRIKLESWSTIKSGLSLLAPHTQFLNLDPAALLRMSQKST